MAGCHQARRWQFTRTQSTVCLVIGRPLSCVFDVISHSTDEVVKQSQTVASLSSVINIVENFLLPPGNLTSTLETLGLTQFQASLQKAGLLESLSTERGITLFAPSGEILILETLRLLLTPLMNANIDSAFATANSSLSSLDTGTLKIVLQNHVRPYTNAPPPHNDEVPITSCRS
jgi:hypothetical protein